MNLVVSTFGIVYCILSRYNYPHHDVPQEVWWYYMVELSFYWSLSFSQFFDVKRKDFVEMFIHHVTTIALLCFSWTCNLFRYISTLATLKGLFTFFKIDKTLIFRLGLPHKHVLREIRGDLPENWFSCK